MGGQKDFRAKSIVVTGASNGIGRCIAIELGTRGAQLCLVGRSRRRLALVEETVRRVHSHVESWPCDLSDKESIRQLTRHLLKNYSRLDVLVHSAGVIHIGTLEDSDVQLLEEQFFVNVRAPYLLTQGVLPLLRKSRGQIIFINSTVGLRSRARLGQYAATKYALKALADALRQEVCGQGIRVLSVYPGRTDTAMQLVLQQESRSKIEAGGLIRPEEVAKSIVETIALPLNAQVTDLKILPMQRMS